MLDYTIGISGLNAAQSALAIIGNNITNAATKGYHRQRINLSPAYLSQKGSFIFGGGVVVKGATRIIDSLLEQEILRQQSSLEQLSQELATLSTIENALGELSTDDGGLNAAIDKFFNALQSLSVHPGEVIWQSQVISDASAMAAQFKALGGFLTTLESQIELEAENAIETVNALISQIAELNNDIEAIEIGGGEANNLSDQRDQYIMELSGLIGVQTQSRDYGVVDVSVAGVPVVTGTTVTELEAGLDVNGNLGISVVGTSNYITNIQGGKIGGLLFLKNELVSDVYNDLDSLAGAIIQQINQYHVQGVGSDGSFTELTGWTNASEDLSDFSTVSAGYVYIRVTDTSTGVVTRTPVPVMQGASSDTLSEVADYITNNVAGVTASVVSSRLTISAEPGYEFDFLPAVLPEPTNSNLTGVTVSVSGIYTGAQNDTFTFEVINDGLVGNDSIEIEVKDGDGNVVETFDVGSGYAAGDELDLGNGIKITLTTGDLVAGETFEVEAFASSDTSGLLAAVGLNTFFSGSGVSDIVVCSDISDNPGRLATALGPEMTDNDNVFRMAKVKEQDVSSLNGLSCGEFYRRLVTEVGQQISLKQMSQRSVEIMVQNLMNKQSEISGVDINNEAAQLLIFEQMFQAVAKYMATIQSAMSSIMELI